MIQRACAHLALDALNRHKRRTNDHLYGSKNHKASAWLLLFISTTRVCKRLSLPNQRRNPSLWSRNAKNDGGKGIENAESETARPPRQPGIRPNLHSIRPSRAITPHSLGLWRRKMNPKASPMAVFSPKPMQTLRKPTLQQPIENDSRTLVSRQSRRGRKNKLPCTPIMKCPGLPSRQRLRAR
jgi:hypothetical protein